MVAGGHALGGFFVGIETLLNIFVALLVRFNQAWYLGVILCHEHAPWFMDPLRDVERWVETLNVLFPACRAV